MKIIVVKDYEEMSEKGYLVIKEAIKKNPQAVLGLATGSTPVGIYRKMAEDCAKGIVSYKQVSTVNLDEYVGLGEKDKQSYIYFMRDNLFNHINIDFRNTHLPNGKAKNLDEECARYSALVDRLRQDVQVLGIGSNGHVGFNEPNTSFDSTTHVVDLTENTIKDNARFFSDISEVPTQAITMGIKNIMNAKSILFVANGANKAQAVYDMIKGEISEKCPASCVRNHPDVTIVIDEAAASKL